MKQKLDEKARGLTPVRNEKAAGANPAESTYVRHTLSATYHKIGLVD